MKDLFSRFLIILNRLTINRYPLNTLLSAGLLALVLVAPAAFAKKDLFGSNGNGKETAPVQTLVTTTSAGNQSSASSSAATESAPSSQAASSQVKNDDKLNSPLTKLKVLSQHLKDNLIETKNSLFGSNDKKKNTAQLTAANASSVKSSTEKVSSTSSTETESMPDTTITATEAIEKAQRNNEGQVINVRKFKDDEKILYGVKLLQKNGRMKTINVDASTGDVVEDNSQ